MLCLCATLLYVIIDHRAANDCTDVISLIYTDTTLTLLKYCNLIFSPLVIMTFYTNIPSFSSLYEVMLSLTASFMLLYALS